MNVKLDRWLALARTPKTRARIRRLTLLARVFLVLTFLSAGAFVLTLVGIVLALIVGIFVPAVRIAQEAPGWIGPVMVSIIIAMVLSWCVTSLLLEAARYADGREAVGVVTEVVADEDSEGQPLYFLTITTELPEGGSIRRTEWVTERIAPRPGQQVRFRHNTPDPDDLDDILFIGFVEADEVGAQARGAS